MVFSAPLFLFLFLPAVLLGYFAAPRRARNVVLLLASLVFYAWGESELVLLLLGSIAGNYLLARLVERGRGRPAARWGVGLAVVLNLGLLGAYKYLGWFWDNAVGLCEALGLDPVWLGERPDLHLPLGISFFTFQALSAIVDVYRGDVHVRSKPLDFALYVSCFPQLVAGPIVRYRDVAAQIASRRETFAGFAIGVRRFLVGLAKKVLIADTLGAMVDELYAVPSEGLSVAAAWLALFGFGLQIYFDFSGYSDMAIGLGRVFGFKYLENFNYPYVSKNIREFWRRWHISLSTWFRDYVYIPLGGNRGGELRTYFNLLTVFVLVGLWHGAAWTFVLFGVFHGSFMILERGPFGRFVERLAAPVQHGYALFVVLLGWGVFRAQGLEQLRTLGAALVGAPWGADAIYPARLFLAPDRVLALVVGCVCALPWVPWIVGRRARASHGRVDAALDLGAAVALVLLLIASVATLSASTLQPFIYFRF